MKTSELIGPALNWAVAECENLLNPSMSPEQDIEGYSPSTNWEQGGPIIEREHIELRPGSYNGSDPTLPRLWAAWGQTRHGDRYQQGKTGQTALIAAMRCYVASKLGDEIEIPEALK